MNGSEVYAKTAPVKLFFMIAIPGAISMISLMFRCSVPAFYISYMTFTLTYVPVRRILSALNINGCCKTAAKEKSIQL